MGKDKTRKGSWRSTGVYLVPLLGIAAVLFFLTNRNSGAQISGDDTDNKEKEIAEEYRLKLMSKNDGGKPCCRRNENGLGRVTIDKKVPESLSKLEEDLSWVQLGGSWEPSFCTPPIKVAIIVAYRNRKESLLVFLRHIHPMMKKQALNYQLFVIEQSEQNAFNKGKLQNIGYKEALKYDTFDCFIFHDVDLIPEDERVSYACPSSPRHMSSALDKFDNHLYSPDVFGGVVAFTTKDFNDTNGYSNRFYGVEGENEDMIARFKAAKKHLSREVLEIGKYAMLEHKFRIQNKEKGHEDMRSKTDYYAPDGLNRLRYKVLHNNKYNLFTLLKVDLLWDRKEKEAF